MIFSQMYTVAVTAGYRGVLGRTALTASSTTHKAMVRAGTYFTGVLPRSFHHPEDGYQDDVIIFIKYPTEGKQKVSYDAPVIWHRHAH